ALGAALLGMLLAKGPAGAPVVGAVIAGVCIVRRSIRPAASPVIWIGVLLASGAAFLLLRPIWSAKGHPEAVLEDVQKFLWDPSRLAGIVLLIPTAFIASLPGWLALILPWGRAATEECKAWGALPAWDRPPVGGSARTLARAWVIAMVVYTAIGIGNVRYA